MDSSATYGRDRSEFARLAAQLKQVGPFMSRADSRIRAVERTMKLRAGTAPIEAEATPGRPYSSGSGDHCEDTGEASMDLNYLLHRQRMERSQAHSAECDQARSVHAALAALYEQAIEDLSVRNRLEWVETGHDADVRVRLQ